jgi:hypothetical protein
MAISTNGTVIARLAGGLYNTVMSNATYLEVASQDPSTLANTLYSRDFAKSTDLAVATTLLANLGLAGQAGLDAWVAAQLTAAGAANKGAKIVSLLNDFAGLSTDATWGTYATAFNTKVDAALAASQKTGSVESKFEAAGSVAVTNATFNLTALADTFTGGAGNDSFVATGTTLTTGDVLTGQAGDSLTITDLAASFVAGLPANITVTGIPTATITSTGALGTLSTAATSAKQTFQFTASAANTDLVTYSHTPTGTTTAVTTNSSATDSADTTGENAAAKAATAIAAQFAKLGYAVTTTANTSTTATVPTLVNTVDVWTAAKTTGTEVTTTVTVTGAPGVVLPVLSVNTNVGTGTAVPVIATTAPSAAVSTAALSVSGWTGLTSFTGTAAGGANLTAAKTTDVSLTNTSGNAVVTGGLGVTVKGTTNSVYVNGAAGAVNVTATVPAGLFGTADTSSSGTNTLTGLNGAWGTYTYASNVGTLTAGQAGVLVTGGTTVSVTNAGGAYTTSASLNSSRVQVGSDANVSANGSTIGQETIRNTAISPTGDVTISRETPYTDASTGLKNVMFGSGTAKVYTNGATTVTVKGAGATTIKDLGTVALKASTNATAVAGTSKLTTVNLAGLSGATTHTITSDAISTISLTNTLTAETISVLGSSTIGVNNGAINFNVSNVGASSSVRVTLSDATATTVNIGSAPATAYEAIGATKASATSASFITLSTEKATAVNLSNTLAVNIGDLAASGVAKVASVNGSAATGGITASLGATPEQGMAFTGGSGNDTVTLNSGVSLSAHSTTGKTTTIDLGAGNDRLLNGGSTHTMVGVTVQGGEGTDTLAATLLTVGNSSQFVSFETLGLDVASGSTMDVGLLSTATGLSLLSQGATYNNVKASQGLTVATDTTAGTNTLVFESAVTAAAAKSDSYTVTFAFSDTTTAATANAEETDAGQLVISGIETVNIVSGGSGNVSNAINLTDTSATKLVVTGDKGLDLDFGATDADDTNATTHFFGTSSSTSTDGLGVTEIDATAMTGKLNIDTTDVALSTSGKLVVNTGSGNDTISLASKSEVNAGAGDDTIIAAVRGISSTLTGGTGKDTFDVTAALAGATGTTATAAPAVTTIKDFSAGDTLKIAASNASSAAYLNGNTLVASATSWQNALDLALKGASVTQAATVWFNYGGNTYIANETDATDGLSDGDIVVVLTGLHTLTASAVVTVTPATGLFGEA